jgi:hypothetical protein
MLKISVDDVADVDAIGSVRVRYRGSQAASHDRINPGLAVPDFHEEICFSMLLPLRTRGEPSQ